MGKYHCWVRRPIEGQGNNRGKKKRFCKHIFVPDCFIAADELKEILEYGKKHFGTRFIVIPTDNPKAKRAELGLSRREFVIYKPLYRKKSSSAAAQKAESVLMTILIQYESHMKAAQDWAEAKWPGNVAGYIIQRAPRAYLEERGNPPDLVFFKPTTVTIRTERAIKQRPVNKLQTATA